MLTCRHFHKRFSYSKGRKLRSQIIILSFFSMAFNKKCRKTQISRE
ncbi:hypothetical protein CLOLEP_01600 [[Clostridium] leptum DSM 753]|uniref:Uncharacterized protein n=1 Tax=[Clostridium] leptum DSM 753 TaxID=428125 RepID=A7VSR0_9FIRM|nr:hypothetical protein CLOLEP_01600 [[Clostridium] leptum DSM 753]